MDRSAFLGMLLLPSIVLLSGCSGLGKFFGDTVTLPGANPNLPYGLDENARRAEGGNPAESPILPEAGNVWPGPPQPLPTLGDVSRTSGNGLGSNPAYGQGGGSPLQGPAMRDGGRMSMGESDQVAHGAPVGAPPDEDGFSGGGSALDTSVPDASSRFRAQGAGKNQPIVIPNGDGTSTVIEPDGTVKTVRDAPK